MNTVANQGLEWLSRTIAIILVMVGPALLGRYLDQHLGTQFLMPTALILGVSLSIFLLLLLAKQFIPPGRGQALPFDDDDDELEDDSDEAPDTR